MEESKPIIEKMNTNIPKEENIQNNSNSNKIIIENDINEFEKPEEPKPISQIQPQEQPQIQPELIQTQPLPNNDQNNNNVIIINNESINALYSAVQKLWNDLGITDMYQMQFWPAKSGKMLLQNWTSSSQNAPFP